MMKGRIVLVEFPYDDLSDSKIRPANCLTNSIGENRHIVLALITSRIPSALLETDIILDNNHPDFSATRLKKPSTLRLNHLITLRRSMIQRQLGELSTETQTEIAKKVCKLVNY